MVLLASPMFDGCECTECTCGPERSTAASSADQSGQHVVVQRCHGPSAATAAAEVPAVLGKLGHPRMGAGNTPRRCRQRG
eukprot:5475641-Alexandrium_andersonii.AAC.1